MATETHTPSGVCPATRAATTVRSRVQQPESDPHSPQRGKGPRSSEDPAQPKINNNKKEEDDTP